METCPFCFGGVGNILKIFYGHVGILGVGYTQDQKYPLKGILASQGIKGAMLSHSSFILSVRSTRDDGIIAKQCCLKGQPYYVGVRE